MDQAEPNINPSPTPSPQFSHAFLNAGFVFGLILAFLSLAGAAFFLFMYFRDADSGMSSILKEQSAKESVQIMAIHARNIQARLSLQACGAFVGVAFGMLGFSLFLIGVKGEMDVDGSGRGITVKVTRLMPGIAILIAAIVLVGESVTHTTPYTFTTPNLTNQSGPAPPLPGSTSAQATQVQLTPGKGPSDPGPKSPDLLQPKLDTDKGPFGPSTESAEPPHIDGNTNEGRSGRHSPGKG